MNMPTSEGLINTLQDPVEKLRQEAARCPLAEEEPDQPGQEILPLPEHSINQIKDVKEQCEEPMKSPKWQMKWGNNKRPEPAALRP